MLEYGIYALCAFAFALGFGISRFVKEFDHTFKMSEYYSSLSKELQMVISAIIDCFHHLPFGLLLIYLSSVVSGNFSAFLLFLGLGLTGSDLPDLPARYREIFKYLKEVYGKGE